MSYSHQLAAAAAVLSAYYYAEQNSCISAFNIKKCRRPNECAVLCYDGTSLLADLVIRCATIILTACRLNKLASLGLPLSITEFSLHTEWTPDGPVNALTEQQHADELVKCLTWWFSHPAVKDITLWGFWDGQHWVKHGGLFRQDGTPKLAATAFEQLWSHTWHTSVMCEEWEMGYSSPYKFRGFYGTYDYSFDMDGKHYSGSCSFSSDTSAQCVVYLD